MKLFSNIVFVWVMLFLSQPAIAADAPVKITLSVQAQDMLKNAPPVRKQKLQKAILAGNKVITRFLDRSIFIEDNKWPERTGSLLGITGEVFNQMVNEWAGPITNEWADSSYQTLLVCPNIRLIELLETENGEVGINYQSTRMGVLIFELPQSKAPKSANPYSTHYSPARKGELHQMKLYLDVNDKLVNVIPQDQTSPMSYKISRSELKSKLYRHPYQDDTPARVQARVASYDQAIKDMDQAATEVCKSIPSNTNITKEK